MARAPLKFSGLVSMGAVAALKPVPKLPDMPSQDGGSEASGLSVSAVETKLVTPEKIALVMALFPIPHSFAELDELVAQGLPKGALRASVDRVCLSGEDRKKLRYRIIPEATYKRRRSRLTLDESGRTERLARTIATAELMWTGEDDARLFLNTPHPMLKGRTPLDVSMTELGARRVEELLMKLFYGISV